MTRQAASKAPKASRDTAKKARARTHTEKGAFPATASAAKHSATAKREANAAPKPTPQFKEVLAHAVRPAEVVAAAQPAELARR